MDISLIMLISLAGLAVLAGFIDAIAGGGGLITIPALLATGMPPTMALGTNKLQGSVGAFSSSLHYARQGLIAWRRMLGAVACTFVGGMLGTLSVQQMDASLLEGMLPVLLIVFALYFLFSPRVGDRQRRPRLGAVSFAVIVGTGIGFYDGFFGPGTGSFFALAFVALAGFNLSQATAHTKLLNFTANLAALLFFMLGGHVSWLVGLVMAAGQFLGAYLGARMVVAHGARLVRPMLVGVSLLMSIYLLVQQYLGG